jgi:hypothetical protein
VCLKAGRGLWDRFPEAAKDASTLHNPAFQTDFQAAITRNFKEDAWRRRFSMRWSRLFGQFSAIFKWKFCFSV